LPTFKADLEAGVISGSVSYAYAGTLAVGGMVVYFISGLLRLAFD